MLNRTKAETQREPSEERKKVGDHQVLYIFKPPETTTVLNARFCLFGPSLWGQQVRRSVTRRELLCPPEEPPTSCLLDSVAVRHDSCRPSSLISTDLTPPNSTLFKSVPLTWMNPNTQNLLQQHLSSTDPFQRGPL